MTSNTNNNTTTKLEDDEAQFIVDEGKEAETVCIISSKGGVGKTTISANLACGLAERGFRVLVIDLDPNLSISLWFLTEEGWQKANNEGLNIGKLLINPKVDVIPFIQQIQGSYYNTKNGGYVDFIPGSNNTGEVKNQLNNKVNNLRRVLDQVRTLYDFIILDAQGDLEGSLAANAFTASTHYLIPMVPEYLAAGTTLLTDSKMEAIKESYNPDIKFLGLLLNKYSGNRTNSKDTLAFVEEQFTPEAIFKTTIPDREIYKNVPKEASSYLSIKDKKARQPLDDFVDEFLERVGII